MVLRLRNVSTSPVICFSRFCARSSTGTRGCAPVLFAPAGAVREDEELVGAEANAIQPGKRPLSSMSPTIVVKDGQPILSVGAAGGPTIITQTLLAIIRRIDLGLPLLDCLAWPRYHHQWSPDQIRISNAFGIAIQSDLKRRGHRLDVREQPFGASQAIAVESNGGFEAVSDPRIYGRADGF